ncbi:unannotated protein [freshwater metagenome]|uniref:Unannotated protein n=1 Tax=freshwater metagenome TaxID=449393 RepID=A0A6J7QHK8_9ZZZZ
MTSINASAFVSSCAYCDTRTVPRHRNRIARIVKCSFTVYICTSLCPRAADQRVDAHMTSTAAVAVRADCDTRTVPRHRNRFARIIACSFTIYICTCLCPRAIDQRVDTHMTSINASAVVAVGADCDTRTVPRHRHRNAREVACSFTVDIYADLVDSCHGLHMNRRNNINNTHQERCQSN